MPDGGRPVGFPRFVGDSGVECGSVHAIPAGRLLPARVRRASFAASVFRFPNPILEQSDMPFVRSASLLAAALALPAVAAETYLVRMQPDATHLRVSMGLSAPLAGTFRGDHHPKTNPGGTQTRPGLFGGSGNTPIPYTASVGVGMTMDTVPSGSMRMTMGQGGFFMMSDLELDMLDGDFGPIGAVLGLTHPTFRTVNPSALFVGVPLVDIPIPAGAITEMSARQTANAIGVLQPTGDETYRFFVLVPAELSFRAQVMDQAVDLPRIPALLPMAGTLWRNATGMGIEMSMSDAATDVLPFTLDPLVDQPFDMPTILPPGQVAHLLFSGEFGALTAERSLDMVMVAEGTPACPIFDLDGDCEVDGRDVSVILSSWGGSGPGDLNGDGVVNQIDLVILLVSWAY